MNCIVFDKTGTLTIGKPVVVNTKLLTNMVLQEFYELVAAAEVGIITFPEKLRLHLVWIANCQYCGCYMPMSGK